jgi:hypothetical protein
LSERDLDALLPTGVHLNLERDQPIDRVGRREPGRRITAVNPAPAPAITKG